MELFRLYRDRQPDGGEIESCTSIMFWSYRETSNWHDIPCAEKITDQFLCQMEAKARGKKTVKLLAKLNKRYNITPN